MNKFSKTAYPRHISQNTLLNSTQQSKEKKFNYDQCKTNDYENTQTLQSLIQRKIQIDPTLLFSGKPHSRGGKTNNQCQKPEKPNNKSLNSTTNDNFCKKYKQRPQSKQQSRLKIPDNQSLNKRGQDLYQRPQTSKGQRNIVYRRQFRNKSLADEAEYEVNNKREAKTAVGSRRRHTAKQIQLQTSIDPQFLALFAS